MIELSEKALGICKENYRTNCGRCPIRPQCCKPSSPGYEALMRWREEVNAASVSTDSKER